MKKNMGLYDFFLSSQFEMNLEINRNLLACTLSSLLKRLRTYEVETPICLGVDLKRTHGGDVTVWFSTVKTDFGPDVIGVSTYNRLELAETHRMRSFFFQRDSREIQRLIDELDEPPFISSQSSRRQCPAQRAYPLPLHTGTRPRDASPPRCTDVEEVDGGRRKSAQPC